MDETSKATWETWARDNIRRGCEPLAIGRILLEQRFALCDIQQFMGRDYPEGLAATDVVTTAPMCNSGDVALHPKCVSLMEIQRELARLSPTADLIERRRGLSGDEFLEHYYAANRPVILCALMELWHAPHKWTPDYLKATCGDEIVEIMAARDANAQYEMFEDSHRKDIKFSEFVDLVESGEDTNDYYLTARNNLFARPGARPLLKDIEIFTEYLKDTSGDGVYLWYGPKGTITPLHHDTMNIFMSQVKGRKQVKLISPAYLDCVYNFFSVYSAVKLEAPDFTNFPKFRSAHIIDVELAPGDVLFLPVGWWHWVKAIDVSMTVSFNQFLFPNDFRWAHPDRPHAPAV